MVIRTIDGSKTALQVIDVSTKLPIALPLNAVETIMFPIVNLKTWIDSRMRTGGTGKVEIGGKVWYYAYPKQMESNRNIEVTYDDTNGKINGGMYGDETADDYGYVKPTSKTKLVKDYVEPVAAKFLKHLMLNRDIEEQGLETLITGSLTDWNAETAEIELVKLKTKWVSTFGTLGKWASDAGFVLPTTGTGLRLRAKTYTDGAEALEDIRDILDYKGRIGLKDGVEPTYPFARGMVLSNSTLITISPKINNLIMKAISDKNSAMLPGVIYDQTRGVVTGISSSTGQVIKVEINDDVPAKSSKAFNFAIEEIGKNGAIAMPNVFNASSQVRPHYEGVALIGKIIEAIGLIRDFKALQPELNWASFEV